MIDSLLKVVNAVSVDVSAVFSAAGLSSTLATLSGTNTTTGTLSEGLPHGAIMTVQRSDTNTTIAPIEVELQYSTDAGTTFYVAGTVSMPAQLGPTIKTAPVGLVDIVPEQQAASAIQWKVIATASAVITGTQDPTFSVWVGRDKTYSNSV